MGLDHGNTHGYTQKVFNPPAIEAYDDFKQAFLNGYKQGYDNGVKCLKHDQTPVGHFVIKAIK